MRTLRRNLTDVEYLPYIKKEEILTESGRHTGKYTVKYGDPVAFRANIGTPNGQVQNQFYGIDPDYTHVMVTDDPDMDISETGKIVWKGNAYEIKAVRPSLNVLSVALKKMKEPVDSGGDGT